MKKTAICLGLLFWTLASVSANAQEYSRGDVNQDGNVNISDVTSLIDYLLNTSSSAQDYTRGDVNRDGNVNISDVTCLIDYLLNGTWPDEPADHEWVDLGLPSGTLWATCNVGANSPEEYGDYFAWGETEPKEYYDWSAYKWCNGRSDMLTKYCSEGSYGNNGYVDNKSELDPEDDAAYINWGAMWRIPTQEQQDELRNNCTWTRTQRNGVNGQLATGPNGNTLFLPAAGFRRNESLNFADSYGYYWSRSLYLLFPLYACNMYFNPGEVLPYNDYRNLGFTVRAVRVSQD